MSSSDKKEDLVRALERIQELADSPEVTELCFVISDLTISEKSGGYTKGETSAEGALLNPAAEPFNPKEEPQEEVIPEGKGKGKVPGTLVTVDCRPESEPVWEPVPCLVTPVCKKAPSYSQVVGDSTSQSVGEGFMHPGSPRTPVVRPVGRVNQFAGSTSVASFATLTAQMAGVPQPIPLISTRAQFLQLWNATADPAQKIAIENQALATGDDACKVEVMTRRDFRTQGVIANMAAQVQAAVAAANQAQVIANAAGNADRFRPAQPPKFGNKKKDTDVRQWLPIIEDYFRNCPNQDYLRMASSFLENGPRSVFTTLYEAYRAANAGAEPPNPRQWFRTTLEDNYGLADLEQKKWDTWNSLRQGPNVDIQEYNTAFQQAATDLAASVTDEQVKIEKYRSGLQYDLRELCRTSPTGARWQTLKALVEYASLQWPIVASRLAKRKSSGGGGSAKKFAGKRKADTEAGGSGSNRSPSKGKAKLGAGTLSAEDRKHNLDNRLCHRCRKPGHQIKDCPLNKKGSKAKPKAGAASGSEPAEDNMEDDFA